MKSQTGWKVAAGAVALALVAAGCGDDDDEEAQTSEDASAEYCALATEMDAQESFPTVEQLEALAAAAPDEIREEIDAVVPVFIEAIEEDGNPVAAFESPVAEEHFPAIEAFEAETCGIGGDEGDDEAGEAAAVDIAEEDVAFCTVASTLDEQDDFPSPEQLEEYASTAPDEIAEEADVVVSAFLEAGDDPFVVFDDPEVAAAFEVIEPFETERCGIEHESDEDEQDASVTELDPDAARVDVTAREYSFELASDPAVGPTSFVMANEGEERHVMVLFRLSEGATMDEVLASDGDEGIAEEYESDTAASGEEAVVTADLVPGDWAMICYLPTPEGTPHVLEGMVSEFSVS